MTKMGGLYPKMKVTALTMLVGVLAIAGTPLFSGWYSKDAILVSALSFASYNPIHFLLFLLPLFTAGITAFYMFRLWLMTFTGEPRDAHVYEHAHESPRLMTVPLIILAFFSIVVAWGMPPWDVHASALEHILHHERPAVVDPGSGGVEPALAPVVHQTEHNVYVRELNLAKPHELAGALALLSAGLGALLAIVVYYWGYLDPADTKAQFAALHGFLWQKWHFDELYRFALVRPALVVAQWCRWFDSRVIDGIIDGSARTTAGIAKWDGRFDLGVVDGLVNMTADVVYAVGAWLRVFQTGLIRSYVLFLAVAAVGIFAVLTYVIALAG
jgi:NADH-quinone oxidoreductase subunit L